MENTLVQTIGLKKYFKTPSGMLHAVDGIDIEIAKGTTLGIVGESGCGKSTLGRVMLRLLDATEGQVLYNGEDILKYDKKKFLEVNRKMQFIFQDPFTSLNPRMTVSQLIAEPLIINKLTKNKKDLSEKIHVIMDKIGLDQRLVNTYPHEMDGGRRQRVGIARALVLNPEFIVCDEPVSSLDVSIQAQILNLLMDLQDELGLTYAFITHDLSVVRHISTEIAVMYLGKCVEKSKTKELFENPKHPYTKALLNSIPVPSLSMRGKERIRIKGEITSPINPKPGCRFATRCPDAADKCHLIDPVLTKNSKGSFVACHLYRD